MKNQPPSVTIFQWLRANLGPRCLAPLTGTDTRALRAAVEIIELYSYHTRPELLKAFGIVVSSGMQKSTQELAYHAIAHLLNWEDRARLWDAAGLPLFDPQVCSFEPGGSRVDLSKSVKATNPKNSAEAETSRERLIP